MADNLIERFDIGEFRDQLIKSVSGGQRRRVDLAASLVTQPQLLVLDEPTTGLDPRSRQVVWSTIRELVAEGVTLLLTTQYLEEADELADHIIFIDHGVRWPSGTPAELRAQIGEQRVDVVATDEGGFDRLVAGLDPQFRLTLSPERRTISIPAPREAVDLGDVTNAVVAVGVRGRRDRPAAPDPRRRLHGADRRAVPIRPKTSGGPGMTAIALNGSPLPAQPSRPDRPLGPGDRSAGRAQPPDHPPGARAAERRDHPADRVHPLFLFVFGSAIHIPGMRYQDYLLPGLIGQGLAFGVIGAGVATATDFSSGVIDRFRSLPVTRLSVITAQVVGQVIEQILGMVIVLSSACCSAGGPT